MNTEAELAVARLANYRFEKNLTFRQLSAEMEAKGFGIPGRSLHLYLTRRTVPVDRTQYRIAQFVATIAFDTPTQTKHSKRRRRAAHAASA